MQQIKIICKCGYEWETLINSKVSISAAKRYFLNIFYISFGLITTHLFGSSPIDSVYTYLSSDKILCTILLSYEFILSNLASTFVLATSLAVFLARYSIFLINYLINWNKICIIKY